MQNGLKWLSQQKNKSPPRLSNKVHQPLTLKRVRFNNNSNHIEPSKELSKIDISKIFWHRKDEYDSFRSSGMEIANRIVQMSSFNEEDSHHRYNNTDDLISYSMVLNNVYKSVCEKDDNNGMDEPSIDINLRKKLRFWMKHGHCRRGLERYSIPYIGEDMRKRRERTVKTIVGMHHLLQSQGTGNNNHNNSNNSMPFNFITNNNINLEKEKDDNDQRAEFLRDLSQKHTRFSRLFAVVLGDADEFAALSEHQQSLQDAQTKEEMNEVSSGVPPFTAKDDDNTTLLRKNKIDFCRQLEINAAEQFLKNTLINDLQKKKAIVGNNITLLRCKHRQEPKSEKRKLQDVATLSNHEKRPRMTKTKK